MSFLFFNRIYMGIYLKNDNHFEVVNWIFDSPNRLPFIFKIRYL